MEPDGIHLSVLKELAGHIVGSLHVIFQWFWESGKLPVGLEAGKCFPSFQEGRLW